MSPSGQTEKNSVRAFVFRFAQTRTLLDAFGMSQKCHQQTILRREIGEDGRG
jgi:hypothetical protein